jgi:hypothetical protein
MDARQPRGGKPNHLHRVAESSARSRGLSGAALRRPRGAPLAGHERTRRQHGGPFWHGRPAGIACAPKRSAASTPTTRLKLPTIVGILPTLQRKPCSNREFPSGAVVVRHWSMHRIGSVPRPGPFRAREAALVSGPASYQAADQSGPQGGRNTAHQEFPLPPELKKGEAC